MNKLIDFKQSIPFQKVLNICGEDSRVALERWLDDIPDNLKSSRVKNMLLILRHHSPQEALDVYTRYWATCSRKERMLILYGQDRVEAYSKTLSARPKPSNHSIRQKSYWMLRRGYTEEEAKLQVARIQSRTCKLRTRESYNNHSLKIKYSIDYWINIGYSKEEAEILRAPYLNSMKVDLASFISRHGETNGKILYEQRIQKYKETVNKNFANRKQGGYVSKESLKFFIPLYKACRKLGIKRSEIFIGVRGSREFFIRHDGIVNTGRFFDFAIPKLGIIIEYNGVFWHPRERNTWKNPWISFDDAFAIEMEKKRLCENRNYDLLVIWSDDDLTSKHLEIMSKIQEKIDAHSRV